MFEVRFPQISSIDFAGHFFLKSIHLWLVEGSSRSLGSTMCESQLIVFIDALADKLSDDEVKVCKYFARLLNIFLLKYCPNDSHMSPKKFSKKLKTWFHTYNNKLYTIVDASNQSENVIEQLSLRSGVALVQ